MGTHLFSLKVPRGLFVERLSSFEKQLGSLVARPSQLAKRLCH
jgi:hypothetical protein